MFQTEIILFLQSFATDILNHVFTFFTEIGRTNYSVLLVFIILFTVNFRLGFIVFHALAWNGLISLNMKEYFALPRPCHVDLNVKLLGETLPNTTHFDGMDARNFLGGLPDQIVRYFRAYPPDSWGFPSGHASQAMTLWGSFFMFFNRMWLRIISISMIVFISFSRMYLGRHFLADILGGLFLGFLVVFTLKNVVYRNEGVNRWLFTRMNEVRLVPKSIFLYIYLLMVPFLILFFLHVNPEYVAAFLGFNIGFLIIRSRGIPRDTGSVLQRIGRLLVAAAVFGVLYAGLEKGMNLFLSHRPVVIEFLRQALTWMVFFWVSIEVSVKLGLYRR